MEVGVKVRAVLEKDAVGRLRATSIVKGFEDAMIGVARGNSLLTRRIWILKFGRGSKSDC